jgi:hypothetical protein
MVLAIGTGLLAVLLARGLDIGPLQTDVIIFRAWFREVGVEGFSQRYFDVNQRHVLVGPIASFLYARFGEWDLPYHLIFQSSRIFEGVFLAGIVYGLTHRRRIALCAGLTLMLTAIRVPELYQGINWHVEPSLSLLLASSYLYVRTLSAPSGRMVWYVLSVIVYALSVLLYEAGLPWIMVNLYLGWVMRPAESRRVWLVVRDALPSLVIAGTVAVALLFVFEPWGTLTPDTSASVVVRLAQQLGTVVTLPLLYLRIFGADGYAGVIILFGLLAAGALLLLNRLTPPDNSHTKRDYRVLIGLALVIVCASVLVGASSQNISPTYLDRITFGRAAGISLLYVTAIFGLLSLSRLPSMAAPVVTALLLIGPGYAWLWIYQDYAQAARAEIDRMTAAVMAVRPVMYAPVHLVILTEPDWIAARFVDAGDVIVHEMQQRLWEQGGDATVDILHTGAYPEEYATAPGSCTTVSGEYSAGICLGADEVVGSRWAFGTLHPNENIVVLQYVDATGEMGVLPEVRLSDLQGYNVATAGPESLATNPERVAVPIG